MVKTILYTSNPDGKVKSLEEVKDFAAMNDKFRSCIARQGSELYGLKEGAHVITNKGNHVYVLEVANGIEEFDGAKKQNITGIIKVDYPFGEPDSGMLDGIKEEFFTEETDDIKMSFNGAICIRTTNGYISINDNNQLVRMPSNFVGDVPAFIMPKPKDQVVPGDIMVLGMGNYAKVVNITDKDIYALSYKNGAHVSRRPIIDFLFNNAYIRVVVTPMLNVFGNIAGNGATSGNPMMSGFNPAMLALCGDGDMSDIALYSMMSQGGQMNPNMFMFMQMLKKNKQEKNNNMMKTLLMSQCLGMNNMFGMANQNTPKATPVVNPVSDALTSHLPVVDEAGELGSEDDPNMGTTTTEPDND